METDIDTVNLSLSVKGADRMQAVSKALSAQGVPLTSQSTQGMEPVDKDSLTHAQEVPGTLKEGTFNPARQSMQIDSENEKGHKDDQMDLDNELEKIV